MTTRKAKSSRGPQVDASKVRGGRKVHGSHRSPILGQVKFNQSPVTTLNQRGVIWTTV